MRLAAAGAGAGLIAGAMVYPYFTGREAFDLERSLAFASSYDGKLGFLAHVHETNLTLTPLHHVSTMRGAHEEIAFPGFTVLAMLVLALVPPLWATLRGRTARELGNIVGSWVVIGAMTAVTTVLSRSMLVGTIALGLGIWQEVRTGGPLPFSKQRGLYLALLLLSIAMFLGLAPGEWKGAPIRGLYYYFYTYFPGFDGIRKVSRQAVMTTFAFVVLASFGAAWLYSKLGQRWARGALLAVLLGTTCYELRCFPHPLQQVWAGPALPPMYRFVATLPPRDLVASLPQNDGVSRFWGDRGMALCNYLAVYHKHRFLNGQGSFMPPVTELTRRALLNLPDDGARRVLQLLEARHILVHAEDLPEPRRQLPELLAAQTEHYRRVFHQGPHSVFTLTIPDDPSLALLDVPTLPAAARPIPREELSVRTNLDPQHLERTIDGDPRTYWSSRQWQSRGQHFELALVQEQTIVALELDSRPQVMHLPMSYELSVATSESSWQVVAQQPELRMHHDQIYSPNTFVFRVVLPQPTRADRIRLTIARPLPGYDLIIHEARLFAQPD